MADNPNAARAIKTNPTYSNVANVPGRAVLESSNRAFPKRIPGQLPSQIKKAAKANAASAHRDNAARAVPGGYRKTRKRSTRRH